MTTMAIKSLIHTVGWRTQTARRHRLAALCSYQFTKDSIGVYVQRKHVRAFLELKAWMMQEKLLTLRYIRLVWQIIYLFPSMLPCIQRIFAPPAFGRLSYSSAYFRRPLSMLRINWLNHSSRVAKSVRLSKSVWLSSMTTPNTAVHLKGATGKGWTQIALKALSTRPCYYIHGYARMFFLWPFLQVLSFLQHGATEPECYVRAGNPGGWTHSVSWSQHVLWGWNSGPAR